MIVWLDAHLSPGLAAWLTHQFGLEAYPVRDLGLREAEDIAIYMASRTAGAVIMTKDADFALLQQRFGAPPQIVWLTCGNSSNAHLRGVLLAAWPRVAQLLRDGEALIEVGDAGSLSDW